MRIKYLFRLFAAFSLLAAFSCAKEIEIEEAPAEIPEVSDGAKAYTLSIVAGKGGVAETKALAVYVDPDSEKNTVIATWTLGDVVEVYDGETSIGTLTAQGSGESTRLEGTLSGSVNADDVLTLKYLSPNYTAQDGTLTGSDTSIDKVCDYATATVTVDAVGGNGVVTIKESMAEFENQQAIVKFTLKESDGSAIAGVSSLVVKGCGETITVTPSPATNVLYVALPAIYGAQLSLAATVTDNSHRNYYKADVTFAKGGYYEVGVRMAVSNVVYNETQLKDAITNKIPYIILGADIPLTSFVEIGNGVDQTLFIDLDGYTLSRRLGGADFNGHVIEVHSKGNLTVTDSSGDNTGTITGGWANNGGGICNYGTVTLNNVNVTGCRATEGGGIKNNAGATLTINGGTFFGNISDQHGGGICNYGTVNLSGLVIITANRSTLDGSGIWNNGILRMRDNIIVRDNFADDIYLKNGKVIQVTGALTGGQTCIGVRMETPGVFTEGYAAHNEVTTHFISSGTIDQMELIDGEGKMYYGFYECSWDSVNKQLVHTVKHVPEGKYVDNICSIKYAGGGGMWGDIYWFIADGTGSAANGLTCFNSEVNLILMDGAEITINEGLFVNAGTTLHIYSQSYGDNMGKLICIGDDQQPGIGPKHDGSTAGTIDIHGGDITATGGEYAAGIGGCEDRASGPITIWDGRIKATGGTDAAGIGGGEGGGSGDIRIYGGDITAKGDDSGAGIGSGENNDGGGDCHRVEIFGGKVNATGGDDGTGAFSYKVSGAGIGSGHKGTVVGPIIIWDGEVNARGGFWAAGIGGGSASDGGPITINGGIVTASAGFWGAGIGGGIRMDDTGGNGGTITVNDGIVTALSRNDWGQSSCSRGAAIGGGHYGFGGTITINGGVVIANSEAGAAIGGGHAGGKEHNTGGNISITGGSVVAISLSSGAGIGGGENGDGGTINISGGEVMAVGGANQVSYSGSSSNTLTHILKFLIRLRGSSVSGSVVSSCLSAAAVSLGKAIAASIIGDTWGGSGIGGGFYGNGGAVTISGGFVVAQGGHAESNAIGKGYTGYHPGSLSITGSAAVLAGGDEEHYQIVDASMIVPACRDNLFAIICHHPGHHQGETCSYCGELVP